MATQNKTYAWRGTNKHGNPEKGLIESSSVGMAKAMLRKKGVIPKSVKVQNDGLFSGFGKKSINTSDITVFSRQLATMIKAGVPLIQSFEITSEGFEKPSMKLMLNEIKNDISGGTTFANSLRKHPKQFDPLYCSLAATGEDSGTLDEMLERIATYKEKSEALKRKIKKALTYPSIVMVFAIAVTAILLIKVVPVFAKTFAAAGQKLPLPTEIVMSISNFAVAYYLHFFIAIIGLFFLIRYLLRSSKRARNARDRWILKIPLVGEILEEAIIARFCRTLSTTFGAGVPVVDALDSVSEASGNVLYEKAINQVREEVIAGRPLSEAIKSAEVFPSRVNQMVGIGEESGTLDAMLDKVATYYEDVVDYKVDNLTTYIEPMIMAFLAIVVGGLMVAMYMPLFNIGKAF
ncbi:MAG: type II secretion system F family protein [Pseudomonadota bacterium]